MPRQFGFRDKSTDGKRGEESWKCDDCPYRHEPGSACPRPGVWLSSLDRESPRRAEATRGHDQP